MSGVAQQQPAKFHPAESRAMLRHPGPVLEPRWQALPCSAEPVELHLPEGATLLAAIGSEMDRLGGDGAILQLDGLRLANCHYVIPAGPRNATHAAWYSETYHSAVADLQKATANVGRRDGEWFVHTHALWDSASDAPTMGHLLNDQVTLTADYTARGQRLTGARLEVEVDPETNFPLFHPVATEHPAQTNAVLLTIRPHTDLRTALEMVSTEMGILDADVHGLGSLIGAEFADAPSMHSPISEVLLLDGVRLEGGLCTALPLVCVDPERRTWAGELNRGAGPVCVTFEMLLLERSAN